MIEFKVRPDGETEGYDITATSKDIAMWERTTKGASMSQMSTGLRMVDLYKIAHFAAVREQMFTGTLSEFEATNNLEFEVPDEADPTQSDR